MSIDKEAIERFEELFGSQTTEETSEITHEICAICEKSNDNAGKDKWCSKCNKRFLEWKRKVEENAIQEH